MGKVCSVAAPITSVNGLVVNRTKLCNNSNYTNLNSRTVDYIVMHYTGNAKDNARNNANYFMTAGRGSSAHYFVDDDSIWQSVDVNDRAWHCGTNGKYYHSSCRNSNSIGIEMCCTAGNYKIGAKALENAAQLVAALCKYLGITDVDKYVVRHYDVTHKKCPAQMVSNSSEWVAFKNRIKEIIGVVNKVEKPVVKDVKIDTVKEVQSWLNKSYAAGLVVDGVYGAKTKAALVKVLQKALNVTVDGVYGNQTNNAVKNLKVGSSGDAVKALQGLLVCNGYTAAYVDGNYGTGTSNAVKSYQKKKGLYADGIAGKATFGALCR